MTRDQTNEANLRLYLRDLAEKEWIPDHVLVGPNGRLDRLYHRRDERMKRCVCIYFEAGGKTWGAGRGEVDYLPQQSADWIGMISGGTPGDKHLWTLQLKSSHGYWMTVGQFNPRTGEVLDDIARGELEAEIEAEKRPEKTDIEGLRAWMRKGVE